MTQIDQAADIREGEELDVSAVDRFMKGAVLKATFWQNCKVCARHAARSKGDAGVEAGISLCARYYCYL